MVFFWVIIMVERIDDTGYTWTKVSQPTKNFYFGEFKKHFVWDPKTETRVRKTWDAKASGRYADFFRDIRAKMVKPIFMSDSAWTNFTSHWATSKYKEIQEKKYTKSFKRIRFLNSYRRLNLISRACKQSRIYIQAEEREGNQASAETQVDETTLYIEAASGAKKRNLYGTGSKRVNYIKDKYYRNETTGITTVNDGWEKKSMKMERKLNKLNKTLEIVCNRFNITHPNYDSDSENTDGGDAYQGPNTSNSRAGESNSRAGEREEDDHDSRMIEPSGRGKDDDEYAVLTLDEWEMKRATGSSSLRQEPLMLIKTRILHASSKTNLIWKITMLSFLLCVILSF
nr:hypothetical protein [Tanacetum cinerariifolium]